MLTVIDDSDVDVVLWAALLSPAGVTGLVLLALAGVIYFFASGNADECALRKCPAGMHAMLANHECLCVVKAGEP